MGAHNVNATFSGKLTPDQLRKAYFTMCEDLRDEYGTDPYNGTFSTIADLRIETDKVFDSFDEADKYCLEHAQKWEFAVAVRYKHIEKKRSPWTFDGKENWSGSMIAETFVGRQSVYVAADQLSADEKKMGLGIFKGYVESEDAERAARYALAALVNPLTDLQMPLPTKGLASSLKKARTALAKATQKASKHKTAWERFAQRMTAKHVKVSTEDKGTEWCVSGWAAS